MHRARIPAVLGPGNLARFQVALELKGENREGSGLQDNGMVFRLNSSNFYPKNAYFDSWITQK